MNRCGESRIQARMELERNRMEQEKAKIEQETKLRAVDFAKADAKEAMTVSK